VIELVRYKMKILQVIDTLDVGGAERVLVDLSNILYENGVEVAVCTIVNRGKMADKLNNGIEHYNIGRDIKYSLLKMYQFYKIAKEFQIVHVHMRYNLKYVWLIKKLFLLKNKIVFHDHYGNIKNDKKVTLLMKIIILDTFYIGVSHELCTWAKKFSKDIKHIYHLSNIIRKNITYNNFESKKERILIISNFKRQKNIEFAVELFATYRKNDEIYFDIYGQPVDQRYLEEIKSKIDSKSINDSINIIHNCSDTQAILKNYRFAIHTSKSESGPLVLLEYMSQGIPFLAYRTGEVAEKIADYFPDFIMDDLNIDKWVNQIKKLMNSDLKQIETKMISYFETNYSEKKYYSKCISIYQNVLIS